jgi:hypothetical protein
MFPKSAGVDGGLRLGMFMVNALHATPPGEITCQGSTPERISRIS